MLFHLKSKTATSVNCKKNFDMEWAYELYQVKLGVSYVSHNKEYGPIIPYLSTDIKLCVAFIKFSINPTC